MALYPLPPSSNESVIDNESNVWQMAMHIILVLQTMSSVSRRDASLDVQRPLRNEQGDNFDLEQSKKNTISTFLSFSARSKVGGRCR